MSIPAADPLSSLDMSRDTVDVGCCVVPFLVVTAALGASLAVGLVTWSLLVFVVAAVGGIVLGWSWYFLITLLSDRPPLRGRGRLGRMVALGGGPLIAVSVALAVAAVFTRATR